MWRMVWQGEVAGLCHRTSPKPRASKGLDVRTSIPVSISNHAHGAKTMQTMWQLGLCPTILRIHLLRLSGNSQQTANRRLGMRTNKTINTKFVLLTQACMDLCVLDVSRFPKTAVELDSVRSRVKLVYTDHLWAIKEWSLQMASKERKELKGKREVVSVQKSKSIAKKVSKCLYWEVDSVQVKSVHALGTKCLEANCIPKVWFGKGSPYHCMKGSPKAEYLIFSAMTRYTLTSFFFLLGM